jgi:SSS family solute:Na+ symporter
MGVGVYYFLQNKSAEDYYVGSRNIKAHHVGMSVVATDVGGGFSIGLGGVGFAMGLAGSWLLFTGLVGAWLSAVLIIPRLKRIDKKHGMMTFPDFLKYRYNGYVALVASLISGLGYLAFSSGQLLAGAKLAKGTILPEAPGGMDPILFALIMIAVITIVYTTLGGLKAVIYTDTIQWIVLLVGLIVITIPVAIYKIGGFSVLWEKLPHSHFSLLNIGPATFINWMITIIPIWFVAMTLYQRIFACATEREAKKAWYIAGILEYPIMAFTGVFLGMCARAVFPEIPLEQKEIALPRLISEILPTGVAGIVVASYFSAIMSTADSCLMASSGNFVGDIGRKYLFPNISDKAEIRLSMLVTMVLGAVAVVLAAQFDTVLDAILYAYSFMVSGLLIPTLGAYFWRRGSSIGAILGMIGGGTTTVLLMIYPPDFITRFGLDMTFYGILVSLVLYITGSMFFPQREISGDR